MRVLRLLVACLVLAAGALLGALNPQPVTIDFGVHPRALRLQDA